jgi:hypothetical protein
MAAGSLSIAAIPLCLLDPRVLFECTVLQLILCLTYCTFHPLTYSKSAKRAVSDLANEDATISCLLLRRQKHSLINEQLLECSKN